MKRIISISLVVATMALGSTSADIEDLQKQIDKLKKQVAKNRVQSSGDNIKWGADLRTAIDSINYDMADGKSYGNNSLMSMRLWLNMAYAADEKNIFKGQLSMNKAFGADFRDPFNTPGGNRALSLGGMFDWTANEALTDNSLKVKKAYWLYLGDNAFGQGLDWTFSIGRRPSTNGFLAHLSQEEKPSSPLAHVINVEFDGLSSKLDLSSVVGVAGMSFKVCLGQGSTNATPLFTTSTPYAEEDDQLNGISLGGFIFEPYNDGQFIVKTTWYRAFDLPGIDVDTATGEQLGFKQYGDMDGAAVSILVDGITDDGYGSDVKVFGSYAWSKTDPFESEAMLGSMDRETGTSYWFGTYLPVGEEASYGTLGLEYNHGDKYWRPFTYAEDTMIGSKIAARGDAIELNYTYQFTRALSLQARYVNIDYDYTGSQGFFGNTSGASMAIDDVKDGAASWQQLGGTSDPESAQVVVGNLMASGMSQEQAIGAATQMGMAASFLPSVVESAEDFRFYLRYRF